MGVEILSLHRWTTCSHDELLPLGSLSFSLYRTLSNLLAQFLMQLHLLELALILLCLHDLVRHRNLLQEVPLLKLLDLANAEKLLLVASQGLSHGKLVLVLRAGSLVWGPAMDITDSQLLPAWGQMRRAVL